MDTGLNVDCLKTKTVYLDFITLRYLFLLAYPSDTLSKQQLSPTGL